MFKVTAWIVLPILALTPALATPLDDALNIQKTKNPLGTLVRDNHGCSLITPPTPLFINNDQPGAAAPGNITIPTFAADGSTYNLTDSGMMCALPKATATFPVKINDLANSVTSAIAYKNNITASLKLTLSSWLKLIDFDAANIEEVGIWITTAESPAFNQDLNRSAATLKKDQCTATKPKNISKAKIIQRACVGKITVSLVAKKDMSLNAFDLQFAKLTVGLKASWIRDINGPITDCTVDASGIAIAPAAGNPPAGGGAPAADKVAASADGSLVEISVGSIEAKFKAPISNVVSKPSESQVEKVTKTAQPKAGKTTAKNAEKPADAPADQKAAKPAEAPQQPASQNKVCAKNVVYQTNGMMVIGVNLINAKPFIDEAGK